MKTPDVVVVSTAYAPDPEWRRRCELSILTQTTPAQHVYLDAAVSGGRCLENLHSVVSNLDPSTVVLWVDGDDWLAHEFVVERILAEYRGGAWLTYGSYAVWEHNHIRRAPEYPRTRPVWECREDVWYASHLKTFRAGLFQRIQIEDLHKSGVMGDWATECCDLAVMWPMLEMAGDENRARHVKDMLYVYNYTNPLSVHNVGAARLNYQQSEARRLRRMQPYNRLETKPW